MPGERATLRRAASAWVFFLLLLTGASGLATERRVALVIGNGAYSHAPTLQNPAHDALAMGSKLQALGFQVQTETNLTYHRMKKALDAFTEHAQGAEVAVVFYAGHGVQVAGNNYLLPVDAKLVSESEVDGEAFELSEQVLRPIAARAQVMLVFLDACRNNPLAREGRSTTREWTRSLGLAPVSPPGEILIAYSTAPGQVAADGKGTNSPFTSALLAFVGSPGIDVMGVLRSVTRRVKEDTEGRQVPWQTGSLTNPVYLALEPSPTPGIVTPEPVAPKPEPSLVLTSQGLETRPAVVTSDRAEARRPVRMYQRWWFWPAVGVVAVGVAGAVAGGIVGAGAQSDPLSGVSAGNRRPVSF